MRVRTNSSWARLLRAAAFALLPLAACSGDKAPRKGQIMLAVQTDMSIPDDVSHVRIIVQKNGAIKFDTIYEVGPGKEQIPATLGLIASDDPEDTVEVRVLGYQRGTVRTLSRAVTTIPQERVATLHVPIQWLCWDQVVATEGIAESVDSSCENPNEACVAGECQDVRLDSDELPDFKIEDIQGGADEPEEGICLDTVACFDEGIEPALGPDCTLRVSPAELPRLNVAVVLPPGSRGICSEQSEHCYVPLDRDERLGWRVLEGAPTPGENGSGGEGGSANEAGAGVAGNSGTALPPGAVTIKLPSAVCERVSTGEASAVRISAACTTKTPTIPTCGPWTSIGTRNPDVGPMGTGGGPVTPGTECPALFMQERNAPIASDPEIDLFATLALELYNQAERLRTEVGSACSSISELLGETTAAFQEPVPAGSDPTQIACDAAAASLGPTSSYVLSFGSGHCRAAASEQLQFEQDCEVAADCEFGSLSERCSMRLSSCDGPCSGICIPSEGELGVACEGHCAGQCEGSCDGTCTGPGGNALPASQCMGHCAGNCSGICQGECSQVDDCSGVCAGACEGTASDEACESPLSVPECAAMSACVNLVAAKAGLYQVCTPAPVLVLNETPPNVGSAITENFPRLMLALDEGHGLSSAIGSLGAASGPLTLAISGEANHPDAACLYAAMNVFSQANERLSVAWTSASRVLAGTTPGIPPTHPACLPTPDDDSCAICTKMGCCSGLAPCSDSERCSTELECLRACVGDGGTRASCSEACANDDAALDPGAENVLNCLIPTCGATCGITTAPSCVPLAINAQLDDFNDNNTISIHGPWGAAPGTSANPVLVAGMSGNKDDYALSVFAPGGAGLSLYPTSCLDATASSALIFHGWDDSMTTVLEVRIRTRDTESSMNGGNCEAPACGDHYRKTIGLAPMLWTRHSIPFTDFLNSQFQPLRAAEILGIDFVSTSSTSDNFAIDDVGFGPVDAGTTTAAARAP